MKERSSEAPLVHLHIKWPRPNNILVPPRGHPPPLQPYYEFHEHFSTQPTRDDEFHPDVYIHTYTVESLFAGSFRQCNARLHCRSHENLYNSLQSQQVTSVMNPKPQKCMLKFIN